MPATTPNLIKLINIGKRKQLNKNIYIPESYGGAITDLVKIIDKTPTLEYLTTKTTSFPYNKGPPETRTIPWKTFPWNGLYDINPKLSRTLQRINTIAEQITKTSYKKGGYCKYVTPGMPKWLSYQGELRMYLPMVAITGHEKKTKDIMYARVVYIGIVGGI